MIPLAEAEFARPDERAAGVISGSDPYRELELYLQKVNDEIGEVFEQWNKKQPCNIRPRSPMLKIRSNSCCFPQKSNVNFEDKNKENLKDWSQGLFEEFDAIKDELENDGKDFGHFGFSDEEVELMTNGSYRHCSEGYPSSSSSSATVSPDSDCSSSSSTSPEFKFPRKITQHWRQKSQIHKEEKGQPVLVVDVNTREYKDFKVNGEISDTKDGIITLEVSTQTSPANSFCSNSTWISDGSNSSSSLEELHASEFGIRDILRLDTDETESGIGTSSPPPHAKISGNSFRKFRRKEAWEKLRKRQGESMPMILPSNQGMESSSDPDISVDWRERRKLERPMCLPLRSSLSPNSSRETLPSPSATSLHSTGNDVNLTALMGKCCSAPHLLKNSAATSSVTSSQTYGRISIQNSAMGKEIMKKPRCQSEKLLNRTEIEASEACKWLRAAGFPQYAQMYEELQFPIEVNLSSIRKDHPFLGSDDLHSLFRRLHALNKCSNMKVQQRLSVKQDDSDSEDGIAISDNWLFQPDSRRWSRICDFPFITPPTPTEVEEMDPTPSRQMPDCCLATFSPGEYGEEETGAAGGCRFRRSGSERLRDGAKAFLRRVESLKSKRRKQKNREGMVISSPQVVDVHSMKSRMKRLNCVDVATPPQSPSATFGVPSIMFPVYSFDVLNKPQESPIECCFSDSELTNLRPPFDDDRNFSNLSGSKSSRTPSRNNRRDGEMFASQNISEDGESQNGNDDTLQRAKSGVARWHSFQRRCGKKDASGAQPMSALTVGQFLILRKLALLKLTAVMEKYCPTTRAAGWNWEFPKFIRKAKAPDYKDKNVFGVPLWVGVQRWGCPLPRRIQEALQWLRENALDQVGLFRKPGVRSRIHKLKMLVESEGDFDSQNADLKFSTQQAFDVADMVKQYFRELPDALLTSKLSETFTTIFQHVPETVRMEGIRCALVLLPDEHRDVLLILLDFLHDFAGNSHVNQMSASNVAVCLAPSLFHSNTGMATVGNHREIHRSTSMSPKRLHKSFDAKEFGKNKATHECLHFLIKNYRELFVITPEMFSQCHFTYMDESIPVYIDELGEELQQDWRGYLNLCILALQKEAKERNRGWVGRNCLLEDVEISYKKVRDGHPLRLWRVWTEVEAPPKEVMWRVLRERRVWDEALLTECILQKLDDHAEIFQYVIKGVPPLPCKDYSVVRLWKTDLPKGGCAIVETSVEHNTALTPISDGVRGIVLTSRYLIEPCGSGKSRILHLSRVDMKGRCSEWYNKCYGHICAQYLANIRASFQITTEGPESKV